MKLRATLILITCLTLAPCALAQEDTYRVGQRILSALESAPALGRLELIERTGAKPATVDRALHELIGKNQVALRTSAGVYFRSNGTNRSIVPNPSAAELSVLRALRAAGGKDVSSSTLAERTGIRSELLSLSLSTLCARGEVRLIGGAYRTYHLRSMLTFSRGYVTMPWVAERASMSRSQRLILAALSHETKATQSAAELRRLTLISAAELARELPELERRGLVTRNGGDYRLQDRSVGPRPHSLSMKATLAGAAERAAPKPAAKNETQPRDPFADVRDRGTKTIDWKKVAAKRAKAEAGGLLHFGLALFLKELALVTATGDRSRIEAFFDGLKTTDFYKHYGLFVAGARIGEVAYARYLNQFVRHRFVSGILKRNLVLATGMALPQIVSGEFEGRAFAITLGSLGISSAAVRAGVKGISWVKDLRTTSTAARKVATATRLARVGGWVYTAAELAVILIVAEKVEGEVNRFLDDRKARQALDAAAFQFHQVVSRPDVTALDLDAAVDAYMSAWDDYREFQYRPFAVEEARLAHELQKVARSAKLQADRAKVLEAKLKRLSSLRKNLARRGRGTKTVLAKGDAEVQDRADEALQGHQKALDAALSELYTGNLRRASFLGDDLTALNALGRGTQENLFARKNRERAGAAFGARHTKVSKNRLQTYEDQMDAIRLLRDALVQAGRPEAAAPLTTRLKFLTRLSAADRALFSGEDGVGISGALSGRF
jgi:DNA-binding MarR family transcriptional regulator